MELTVGNPDDWQTGQSQDHQGWTPEGDTLWTDFLANVFGEGATEMGNMPTQPPEAQARPSVSFGMNTGGGEHAVSEDFSGTDAGGFSLPRSPVNIDSTEQAPFQFSAPSAPAQQALTQPRSPAAAPPPALSQQTSALPPMTPMAEGQPNVFQPLKEYAQNLSPPPAETEPPNNAHVQVMPDGTILLRIGGQWVPLGQPQPHATTGVG